MRSFLILLLLLIFNAFRSFSQEPIVDSIRILCLYGSIPAKGFQGREPFYDPNNLFNRLAKMHGGHVAIEFAPDKALSFQPMRYTGIARSGHLTNRTNPKNFNSCFRIYTAHRAWTVLGNYYNNLDSLRRATFVIPVTAIQKKLLDSIARAYVQQSPYDYSFLGMRCASSSYEVLAAAGIVTILILPEAAQRLHHPPVSISPLPGISSEQRQRLAPLHLQRIPKPRMGKGSG